jgi:hypothetical protein
MKNVVYLAACALILTSSLYAQESTKPIRVCEAIGDTLDLKEREQYNLLPAFKGFQYAVFFLNDDSTLRATVHIVDADGAQDIEVPRYRTLSSLREHVVRSTKALLGERADKVYLTNGSVLIGIIIEQTPQYLRLNTSAMGVVKILTQEIDRIDNGVQTMQDASSSLFAFNDPNTTRTFLMPTAQTLPAGRGYVGVFELFLLTFAWAPVDNVMLNGGLVLLPIPLEDQILNFGLKIGFGELAREVAVGAGVQFLTIPGEDPVGMGYGVISLGNANHKLNIGAGFGFELDNGNTTDPVFAISGDARLSESAKIIAEAWIFPVGDFFVPFMLGFRFFGKNLSGDIGLMYPIGEEFSSPVGFPVGNLIYTF